MNGTERTEAGGCERSATADGDAARIAAEGGIEEKRPPMEMMKEMFAAPGRAPGPCTDKGAPALPPDWQGHLGAQLRAVYGELVNEPVPDKFFHLLKELEAKEQEGKS
jgi:hypothetical protein